MAVTKEDGYLRRTGVDTDCDVRMAVAVEVGYHWICDWTTRARCNFGWRAKSTFAISQHDLKMLDSGRIDQQNQVQMSITVDIGQRDGVWSAGNGEKSPGCQRATTSIQKNANIVQRWIGNDYVRLTVTIQVANCNQMVLAISK